METSGYKRGYWNGLPTRVRKVTGTIVKYDPDRHPNLAWWKDMVGQTIVAVEVSLDGVNYGGGTIYLDDRKGEGWRKVTDGRGSPSYPHAEVPLENVEPRID